MSNTIFQTGMKKSIRKECNKVGPRLEAYQDEYLELLESYEDLITSNPSFIDIITVIDAVDKFWRSRLSIIEKDIDVLVESGSCMILSGAIYLDYAENDHYRYKALGHYHLLHDSILKLEHMFRVPEGQLEFMEISRVFKNAFQDELLILRNTNNEFLYVPLHMLESQLFKDKSELLMKGFWSIISHLFNKNIESPNEFIELYPSYADIEQGLGSEKIKTLIFNGEHDSELSIEDRVETYINNGMGLGNLLARKTDAEKFLTVLRGFTLQVMDILMTGVVFQVVPFIRFYVTFHYFILINHSFADDKKIKSMIERAIITYIFYHEIDVEKLAQSNFEEFCVKVRKEDYLQQIIIALKENKIDITNNWLFKLRDAIHRICPDFV